MQNMKGNDELATKKIVKFCKHEMLSVLNMFSTYA